MESHTKVDHEYHGVPGASTMAAFKTCVTSMCRSGFLNRALVQFLAMIFFWGGFFLLCEACTLFPAVWFVVVYYLHGLPCRMLLLLGIGPQCQNVLCTMHLYKDGFVQDST